MANLAYSTLGSSLGECIWRCNLNKTDVVKVLGDRIGNCELGSGALWLQVVEAWCELNYTEVVKIGGNEIIWYNSHIRVQGLPIYLENSFKKGLLYVHQLYQGKNLISVGEANKKFGLSMMDFYGIVTAIPRHWKDSVEPTKAISLYDKIKMNKHVSRYAYKMLCNDDSLVRKKCLRWEMDLGSRNTIFRVCKLSSRH